MTIHTTALNAVLRRVARRRDPYAALAAERRHHETLILIGARIKASDRARLAKLEAKAAAAPPPVAPTFDPAKVLTEGMFEASLFAHASEVDDEPAPPPLRAPGSGLSGQRRTQALIANHHVRALKLGVVSTLSEADWGKAIDAQEGKCMYCQSKPGWLTVEHLIPVSKGGPNSAENVVAICNPCNVSKSATDLLTWLELKGFDADRVFARMAEISVVRGIS